jgi:magnesium transporter
VLEVYPDGDVAKIEVSRRQLLRSSAGLRLRDIRSVDPALWVTNSAPALLVRDQAILLNFGSLRAIATPLSVLVFDYNSLGAQGFMNALLPRLRAATNGPGPIMPFELEVVEAALISRTQRLEQQLMDVEPRVLSLLKVLPNRYTVDVLEELRLCKQSLVELSAKAGAVRQILLELLENPQDIRQMTIMGRVCNIRRGDGSIECSLPSEKKIAEGT